MTITHIFILQLLFITWDATWEKLVESVSNSRLVCAKKSHW